MSGVRHFTDLIVWQLADQLRVEVFNLTKRPRLCTDFKRRSQLDDAADSACRNIAKGFGGQSNREFARFVRIARRPLNEAQDGFRSALIKEYVTDPSHHPRSHALLATGNVLTAVLVSQAAPEMESDMRKLRTIVIPALVFTLLPVSGAFAAQRPRHPGNVRDRLEDVRDRREDRRDRREDVLDRREDVRDRHEDIRDAQHDGGLRDRLEDRRDRLEDRRDRREDLRDRREDLRDRREDRRDRRR